MSEGHCSQNSTSKERSRLSDVGVDSENGRLSPIPIPGPRPGRARGGEPAWDGEPVWNGGTGVPLGIEASAPVASFGRRCRSGRPRRHRRRLPRHLRLARNATAGTGGCRSDSRPVGTAPPGGMVSRGCHHGILRTHVHPLPVLPIGPKVPCIAPNFPPKYTDR
jgi:hypothetical protein